MTNNQNWQVTDATGEWEPFCEGSFAECKEYCEMYGMSYVLCYVRNYFVIL